ncbi:MAG: histidine kinase [Desulfuromonas sp.]|mgnify:CR=1 FL=1|nr:MAG: histidine kinase [Desulfuromonas sp.]
MPSTAVLPLTYFASSRRLLQDDLERQRNYFSDDFIARHIVDAVPTMMVILNDCRQIVYANRVLLDALNIDDFATVCGARPGEAFSCLNADVGPSGCGTGEACSACGMVATILAALEGKQESQDCQFTSLAEGEEVALDVRASSTPLTYQGESFVVFSLQDISDEKRRQSLERIFFHDILNVVGSIRGFSDFLRGHDPEDRDEIVEMIYQASGQAVEEIQAQRQLLAAENRELVVRTTAFDSLDLLLSQVKIAQRLEVAEGCEVLLAPESEAVPMTSDATLLSRILGNLLKNAIEASPQGGVVTAGCNRQGESIQFFVHNLGEMPRHIQLQIFRRSFSTKGRDRGLGTYSIKLLSRYLKGKVEFETGPCGTTFTVCYPLHLDSSLSTVIIN